MKLYIFYLKLIISNYPLEKQIPATYTEENNTSLTKNIQDGN